MAKFKPLPPLAELREAFDYDPETGLFTHAKNKGSRGRKGHVAGSWNAAGYLLLGLNKHYFYGHRAAWLLITSTDPVDYEIDHIDRDSRNNRFNNLRLTNRAENQWNTPLGRGWDLLPSGTYRARIDINGKFVHLGTFSTAEEAKAAYDAKAVELRGEFAPQECRQDSP